MKTSELTGAAFDMNEDLTVQTPAGLYVYNLRHDPYAAFVEACCGVPPLTVTGAYNAHSKYARMYTPGYLCAVCGRCHGVIGNALFATKNWNDHFLQYQNLKLSVSKPEMGYTDRFEAYLHVVEGADRLESAFKSTALWCISPVQEITVQAVYELPAPVHSKPFVLRVAVGSMNVVSDTCRVSPALHLDQYKVREWRKLRPKLLREEMTK